MAGGWVSAPEQVYPGLSPLATRLLVKLQTLRVVPLYVLQKPILSDRP